jgi:hypothetical protein
MLIVKAVNIINKYFSKVFDISITIKYKRKKKVCTGNCYRRGKQ